MNPQEARQYLQSFINYETDLHKLKSQAFKLDRVKALLKSLGNPPGDIPIIHVAGTMGKGSTCAFTASILREAGYKVGLYTSPHLYDYTERIRILQPQEKSSDADPFFEGRMTDEELSQGLSEIVEQIESVKAQPALGRLTFFEIYTVLAIDHFCRSQVDVMVLETGLGGRLDATNAFETLVCGITPISLEHTRLLGETLSEIAQEKAAIIKDQRQVSVIGPQDPEAEEVIRRRCEKLDVNAVWINQDLRYEKISVNRVEQVFRVQTKENCYDPLKISLLGEHQLANAALAIGLAESLKGFGYDIRSQAVEKGVAKTVWPGRFEVIQDNPSIILDGAHHPAALKSLAKTVRDVFPNKKILILLGCSRDKNIEEMCAIIMEFADEIILTQTLHPRALDFQKEDWKRLFPNKSLTFTNDIQEACDAVQRQGSPDDVIVITGSIFLVGEIRKRFSYAATLES